MPTSPAIAAIVLLLNGVQIEMPHPAVLVDGVGCVPIRPVIERLGGKVTYRPGRSISVQLGADAVAFPLAPAGGELAEKRAVSIRGAVYVSGRDLAAALGGICRWQPELRALELLIPPPPAPADRPVGISRALMDQARALTLETRMADRSASLLSPTLGSSDLPPRTVTVDTLSALTKCVVQDNDLRSELSSPITQRGHWLALEGRWEFQGTEAPAFLAWRRGDAEGAGQAAVSEVSTHRRLYARGEQIVFLLRRSGARPPDGCALVLAEPSGETTRIEVPDGVWRRAEIGGAGAIWSGQMTLPVAEESGRRGLGLWSAVLQGPDGRDECRCWFLVAPGTSGGAQPGGR